MRDQARTISIEIGIKKEFTHLNKLIGAMLRTNRAVELTSPVSRARDLGIPYDPKFITVVVNILLCTTTMRLLAKSVL